MTKPHGWCAPTCPRQTSHNPDDCDCGGFEREVEMSVAYMRAAACHHPTPKGDR